MSTDKPRVLVCDGTRAVAQTLRKYLDGAGYTVETAESVDDALARLRTLNPAALVCGVGAMDGEELCRKALAISPSLPVVLVYPPEDDDPEERATRAGAEAYLVGPIKRGTVVSCVKSLFRIGELKARLALHEKDAEKRITSPAAAQSEDSNIVDFDFFKRLLLMEVKRSKRYKYPNSFLLVAVDGFREITAGLDGAGRGRHMGQLLGVVTKAVRDIDLVVLYAEEKFLVFLPHTDQHGATLVAGRIRERVEAFADGPHSTVSIGVSSYDGEGGSVSFGGLLKEATGNLKKAQTEGGNRVEAGAPQKPRERISIG